MDQRRLAGTDLAVSVVCFGPIRAARKEPGDDPHSQASARALRRAGPRHQLRPCELRVRRALDDDAGATRSPKRHDIHHFIEVPVPDWDDDGRFDAGKMRRRIEEALAELCCERLAVPQWISRTGPNEDAPRLALLPRIQDNVVACFEQLRDQGKATHLWTFPYTEPTGRAELESGCFGGLIGYYNPIEMDMAELFPT